MKKMNEEVINIGRYLSVSEVPLGYVFRKPGELIKWTKVSDEKAVKTGWIWCYWVTDGVVKILMSGQTRVFVTGKKPQPIT